MNNNLTKTRGPAYAWIGLLAFLFPFLSLITPFGVGLSSFLFLLTALFLYKNCHAALVRHWPETRWVAFAFLFNFAFAFLCYLVRPEVTISALEKPSRMFSAVSAMALVVALRPSRRALWWGVIAGAVGAMAFVGYQRLWLEIDRPGGLLNAITFGDLALCLALLAMVATIDFRHSTRQAVWPALGALAGLAASVMTGTRGGWIALVVAALVFIRIGHLMQSRRVRALLLASFALFAASYFVPAFGMHERAAQGVDDVRAWLLEDTVFTNVGLRLELWKGAAMLIAERPLFGLGLDSLRGQMEQYVAQGRLDPAVLTMPHLHNEVLQALATGGIIGLLAWAGMFVAPLLFFARLLKGGGPIAANARFVPALAGLLVVLSYLSFGLTEVIFWSVKGSLFYALMVFLLMGFCLIAKEEIGK